MGTALRTDRYRYVEWKSKDGKMVARELYDHQADPEENANLAHLPSQAATLEELGRKKTGRVDVVCPGFVGDCLETLEEIAMEGKASYLQAGGREYHYIPCINERDDWIRALT